VIAYLDASALVKRYILERGSRETIALTADSDMTATSIVSLAEVAAAFAKAVSGGKSEALRWIRAQAGKIVRLIAVDDVDYLRSDAKYTIVTWRDGGKPAEAVVRTPLKDLLEQLDAEQFAQVHRSVVVNLRAISHVKRHDNETAEIHLKGRDDVLPVSRNYLHLFRQM
jgi:DNA-binding LytR/AlgR family response regulator